MIRFSPSVATGTPPAPETKIRIENGLLSLEADGAPLAEVLRAVGEAGAFRVVVRGELATVVRDSFEDQPLKDALLRLAGDHSMVLMRWSSDPEFGAPGLAEIRVIGSPAAASLEAVAAGRPPPDGAGLDRERSPEDTAWDRASFRDAYPDVADGPRAREEFLYQLEYGDPAERTAAVPLVGSLGGYGAVAVLPRVFAGEDDALVRSRAVAALTRIKGPRARLLLQRQAVGDENPALRMQALNALAATAGPPATGVLGRASWLDPEPEVRVTAVRALGRLGGDWARGHLERAALDVDAGVARAAEWALAARPARGG